MLSWLFSTKHERDIKAIQPIVEQINSYEEGIKALSDEAMKAKTAEFKQRLADGAKTRDFLPEAFALVREAAVRTLGQRHFDVQLIGGFVLYQGKISEMKTGEGKTLVATLAAYLHALEGKGVHIVTVNDYLAKRDCEWMGPIYEFLGLTVDCIDKYVPHSPERVQAYRSDITYGTNNEFGFDYLRDNMVEYLHQKVQRKPFFCIIDEVDSVLIDEARTPLIISGPSESNVDKYYEIDKIIPRLKRAQTDERGKEIPGTGDYIHDEKDRHITITEDGVARIEKLLGVNNLFSIQNVEILHHVNQALRAHKIMVRDQDYIVEGGEVVIVDEFTGRKMEGRRYSDGLHQAIEAKERVNIKSENQTLATITYQNLFKMYEIIAGMTGTADTEAEEFRKIYNLEVVVVPTHKPMIRDDQADKIYRTEKEKFNAIIDHVRDAHIKGQPVLIGTASVDKSEVLHKQLSRKGLQHEVLNAKNHEREAQIIEKAGERGAITIATNMAGRGTDIKLTPGILELGGLMIVGSERHEARRVDNQLRGRSGRQGDPGESIFYLSLEDDLMKRFAPERISNLMLRLGMEEGQEIQHPWISKAIENAQKKVEGRNFEIRKHLLEYDDVMSVQRKFIYTERDYILTEEDILDKINEYIEDIGEDQMYAFSEGRTKVTEELHASVEKWLNGQFGLTWTLSEDGFMKNNFERNIDALIEFMQESYKEKRTKYPLELISTVEKQIMLHTLDTRWKEHLLNMDHLREGISLRSYAEKRPLIEFKREGFKLFEDMIGNLRHEVSEALFRVRDIQVQEAPRNVMQATSERHDSFNGFSGGDDRQPVAANQVRSRKDIGRNEPCYCGSGKKYKHCHGKTG